MPELDNLLSRSMESVIKEKLGEKTFQKIETRIFEKYGINISQSLEDFTKLDLVLREFFGMGADGLEKQFLRKIITLENTKTHDPSWITLESKSLSKSILAALSDPDMNNIINSVLNTSHVSSEILEICKIPQEVGQAKIKSLIDQGLLVFDGFIETGDKDKSIKYRSIVEDVKIETEKNNIILRVKIPTKFLEKSSILQVVEVC
jgi:hypothetical protein